MENDMTDIPLNTRIEWTERDRERGKSPVPNGSEVTVWLDDGLVEMDTIPSLYDWDWGECETNITAYMVHSMPQQPREWWIDPDYGDVCDNPVNHYIHVREVLE